MSDSDRFEKGAEVMQKLLGRVPEEGAMQEDFRQITVKNLFGDIWTRPGLAVRDRSLITCAVLTALGREPQLRIHMKGALNVGISREEILEMMVHIAHYAGWPTAVNGTHVAEAVFKEIDEADG